MNDRINLKVLSDSIPNRLKIARMARGYKSRSALAQTCGTAITTYRAHERGDYEVKASDIICYTHTLDISINWLLTGQGHPLDHQAAPDSEKLALFLYYQNLENSRMDLKQSAEQEANKILISNKKC